MTASEVILISSFVVNSVIEFTKNINHIKTSCFQCSQKQSDTAIDHRLDEIENLLSQTIESVQKIKSKTPRPDTNMQK